jgi:Ribosomal proteins 50S-L18Ae/60S-L20/60S-L18A
MIPLPSLSFEGFKIGHISVPKNSHRDRTSKSRQLVLKYHSTLSLPSSSSTSAMSRLHEYQVIGRKLPTENDAVPKLYRMRIFAPRTQVAKSRFWYFLKQARKVKKASGEIVAVNEVEIYLECKLIL